MQIYLVKLADCGSNGKGQGTHRDYIKMWKYRFPCLKVYFKSMKNWFMANLIQPNDTSICWRNSFLSNDGVK